MQFSPNAKRMVPVVTRESVERFLRRYVTLGELCRRTELHYKQVRKWLQGADIDELLWPETHKCVAYDRERVDRVAAWKSSERGASAGKTAQTNGKGKALGIFDTTIKTVFTQYPARNLRRLVGIPEGATALPTEFTRVEFVDEAVSSRAGERLRVLLSSEDGGPAKKRKQTSRGRDSVVLAQSLEVDFLVRSRRRGLAPFIHVEFQSTIQATMPSRMLLYRAGILDHYGDWTGNTPWVPEVAQVVVNLYKEPWSPRAGIATGTLTLDYRVVDLCAQSPSTLLEGGDPADAVVSLLCRGGVATRNIDGMMEIVASIADERVRRNHLAMALALAKLRDAQGKVENRIMEEMPIDLDLSGSELLSRPIAKAYDQGAKAFAVSMFDKLVKLRFGSLAVGWSFDLSDLGAENIEALALQIYQTADLEQLKKLVEDGSGDVLRREF